MRKKLSVNSAISSSFAIAILAWAFFSLPIFDSYGLTNHILIHSTNGWVVILQRIIHLAIFLVVIYYFMRDKVSLWYDTENLYVQYAGERDEVIIPLKDITNIEMQPTLLKIGTQKLKYSISYIDKDKQNYSVDLTVQPGKTLNDFTNLLKLANPNIIRKDYTLN